MNFTNMTAEQLSQYDWGNSDIEFENPNDSDNESVDSYISSKDNKELPKLEKLEPILDNILLSKFTELTKMFYSAIKNSNMSEEAKSKLREPYKKIENEIKGNLNLLENKKKKKCDNSSCSCTDCTTTKKRWTAKKMFLTVPYNCAPKDMVMEYFKNKYNLCKIAVATEIHKEAKQENIEKYGTDKHIHIYIEWTAKKDIKNPSYLNLDSSFKQFGNINTDIETIRKRTKENVYSYMLKTDKDAISYGFNIHYDTYGKLKKKELYYKLVSGEWSLKDLMKYDPSLLATINIETLYKRIQKNWDLATDPNKQYMFNRQHWSIDNIITIE